MIAITKSIHFYLLLVVVFLLDVPATFAQTKMDADHENFFRFGAKAGVNINKITGKAYTDGFNYNFQGGVFAQFNFSKIFGIQPEVSFVQSQSEFTNDTNAIYDDLFGGGTQHKAKLNYLEIPVLLNINVGPSKRVKLQLGPSYGALLKQTVDSLKTNGNIYKNAEWSAIGGLWFQLPFVNLSARYKLGLSDINSIDKRQTWKNQAIQISAGFTF
jgi:hypothetical protein